MMLSTRNIIQGIPTRKDSLVHAEREPYSESMMLDTRSVQLCTSHFHADRILVDRLLVMDPFCRNGCPIAEVWEDRFRYQ